MSALSKVVRRYTVTPSHAGTGPRGFDRAAIQRELSRLRRNREISFWIMFLLFIVLFAGGFVAAIYYRSEPSSLRQVSAATGVTLMGVMAAMFRLWTQKVRTELVFAIVTGMPEDAVKAVLATLVNRL